MLFLLFGVLYFLIQLPVVQTWVVKKTADFFSQEWQTRVEVKKVNIVFFDKLQIEGIFIGDRKMDTLIAAETLQADISLFDLFERKVILEGISISNGTIKVIRDSIDRKYNFDYLIQYFSPKEKDTIAKPFHFDPGEVTFKNMVIAYIDKKYIDVSEGIDFDDIRLNETNISLDDIQVESSGIYARINNISFAEKSGFRLEYLESELTVNDTIVAFNELSLKTPGSLINGSYSMQFNNGADFEDYIAKVIMRSELYDCKLSSRDLAYFAPELSGSNLTLGLSGNIKGTVENLRGKNLTITFGKNTMLKGDVSISGLPEIEETYFDIDLDKLTTNYYDLTTVPPPPFSDGGFIEVPKELSRLGKMDLDGKFNGFLNDFVAYANFNSAAGFISTDINLKLNESPYKGSYSGHVNGSEFDLGLLTGNSILGKSNFKINVVGKGFDQKHLHASLKGEINKLYFKGYPYTAINVQGIFTDRNFDGDFTIADPNLDMDFKGFVDLKSKTPTYAFNTEIRYAKLSKLGIIERDTSSNLSFNADISLEGLSLNDITGTALFNKIKFTESEKTYEVDDINLIAGEPDRPGFVSIESDILDLEIQGDYKRSELPSVVKKILAERIPIIKGEFEKETSQANISFDLQAKNSSEILQILQPEWKISFGTRVIGSINSETNDVSIRLKSDSISYDISSLQGVDIEFNSNQDVLEFQNRFKKIVVDDTLVFINPFINGQTTTEIATFTISSESRDSSKNDLQLTAEAVFKKDGNTEIRIKNADLVLNGKKWKSNDSNLVVLDDEKMIVENLGITSGQEAASVSGTISKSLSEQLKLDLSNFETELLNPILAVYGFNMSGTATGSAQISGLLSKPGINSELKIGNLAIYADTLGDAEISFNFDAEKMEVGLEATVDKGSGKTIDISGIYFIDEPTDRMDFTVKLQKTSLSAFSGYTEGIISDLRGKASGELRLTGNFEKPVLNGKIKLQQTSFLFDYLNTRYSLADEIEFNDKYFRFRNITVNDENGNQAKVDGYVYHEYLKNFNLKFDITASNLQMLNTGPKQNELYYGKAYGSGRVKVLGPLDLIRIEAALKTEKNTILYIPLSNPEEVSQSGFINFIQKDSLLSLTNQNTNEFSGIELELDISATNDAEVQLIFDSKIGDIIKGRGNGNLKMNIDRLGNFKMFGNLQVESGDYLFTLQNLINKKFIILPGGTIKWNGDPYDALVDLEGVYKLRASLYDLIKDSTLTQRVPVEVHLKLKEKLFNPTLDFDVIVPDVEPTAQALLNRYISTDQEKSTQTMSLLVLNRFSQANDIENQNTNNSTNAIGSNAAELLSQQLSVWASQISNAFNLGVNYRAADAFSQEEYELELSTRLWNDRINIDGNLGLSDNKRNTTSGIVGDFNAEVKVSKDGRFRFKVFNKTINNILSDYNSPYTQGIGILYRKEFENLGELFRKSRNEPK